MIGLLQLGFLVLMTQEESLERLAARWRQDNPATRESASKEIVRRWKTWKEPDLAALAALAKDGDKETAARAADALRAIRFRRDFGEALYPKIEEADALLEEHRTSGAPVVIVGWGIPGGPMFSQSEAMKKLVMLGPDVEPFVRPRLRDPALRNDIAVVLTSIGTPDSLAALIDALPAKDEKLTPAEDFTFTCVLNALYELTGKTIGMTSRERAPYSPDIRARWGRWHDAHKDYLYRPSGSDPTVERRWIGGIVMDTEAQLVGIPTREYRKTHPFLRYNDIKIWQEGADYERRLREFCIQHLLRSLWRAGNWNDDAITVAGSVEDPRILGILRRVAAEKDVPDFTLNRTCWALKGQGAAALPDLEKLVADYKGKELRFLQIPLAWARLDQKLGRRRFSRRVSLDEATLLARCGEEEAARKDLAARLRKLPPSRGCLEIAGAVADPDVAAALQAVVENEPVAMALRLLAASALGKGGIEFLRARLEDKEPLVRLCAAEGLWKSSNREGFPTLLALLQLRPLQDGNAPSTVHTTTPPKEGSSLDVVRRACEILGEMGDPAAVEPLKKLLPENLNGVRGLPMGSTGTGWYGRPDVVALAKLGDFSGMEILARSARSGDPLGAVGTMGVAGDYELIGIKKFARDLLPALTKGERSWEDRDLFAARSILILLDKGR